MQVLPFPVLPTSPQSPAATDLPVPLPFEDMLFQVADKTLPREQPAIQDMAVPLEEPATDEDTDVLEEVMEFCHVMEPSRIPDAPLPVPTLQPVNIQLAGTGIEAAAESHESPEPNGTEVLTYLSDRVDSAAGQIRAPVPLDTKTTPAPVNTETTPAPLAFSPPPQSLNAQETEPPAAPVSRVLAETLSPLPVTDVQAPEAPLPAARANTKAAATETPAAPLTTTPPLTAPVPREAPGELRPAFQKPAPEAAVSRILEGISRPAALKNTPETQALRDFELAESIESSSASAIMPRDIAPETTEVREALFGALTQFFNTRENTQPVSVGTKDTLPGMPREFSPMLQTRLSSLRWQPQAADMRASAKIDAFSARIRVYPANLGEVLANIEVRDGVASVRFGTDNTEVRHFLESTTPELREAFNASRLVLDEVFVQSGLSQQQEQQDARKSPFETPRFLTEDTPEAPGAPSREPALNSDSLVDAWA
ncbi:Flagellar hook-length control protein FliK [Legionella geestiana]|uniref:Flagellar hook-length control protein FliK n=1 Tax=Legionella geestiana TaxID=45065 RepID=A0A0W0U346_9GAMM|nr:flagellar hook-length control protein FliK [Legionella geestiana]KTD02061.1 Flagellar hook-length control protein FliK [Legionella geestiana]QBS11860.1 flagellar hook-length control protein FliK [Legionella geestiana]STX53442.1 Flagellar hook-length control protein FliK [Legionella geestiana]